MAPQDVFVVENERIVLVAGSKLVLPPPIVISAMPTTKNVTAVVNLRVEGKPIFVKKTLLSCDCLGAEPTANFEISEGKPARLTVAVRANRDPSSLPLVSLWVESERVPVVLFVSHFDEQLN